MADGMEEEIIKRQQKQVKTDFNLIADGALILMLAIFIKSGFCIFIGVTLTALSINFIIMDWRVLYRLE